MKEENVQAREKFLDKIQKLAKKSGIKVNVFGRAAWEQRAAEKLSPWPSEEKRSECKQEGTKQEDEMTDKTLKVKDHTSQTVASQQQILSNPQNKAVFIQRAKGMPFDEFKKVCIQRFRDAGLLAEGSKPPNPCTVSPSNEQNLTDGKDLPQSKGGNYGEV